MKCETCQYYNHNYERCSRVLDCPFAEEKSNSDQEVLRNHDEAKAVLYTGDGYADGYMVYDSAECPNCGYSYEENDSAWKEPYCPHCGQRLNWDHGGEML